MKDLFMIHQILLSALFFLLFLLPVYGSQSGGEDSSVIKLPEPVKDGKKTVERALSERRSVRDYRRDVPLLLEQVSQLLWAAQGVTDRRGLRTAPSAGALYPLEVYVVAGRIDGLLPGVYRYMPSGHELLRTLGGDRRQELASASLGQSWVRDAPASIVIAAVYERTTRRYRDRGVRYVHMEVGHAAQNVCLQAVALGLAGVVVGAFQDNDVKRVLQMPESEEPLAIIPVGRSQ